VTLSRLPPPAAKGGRKSQGDGKAFESLIVASVRDREGSVMELVQIPSGAQWIGKGVHIPKPSPFDFAGVAYGSGRAVAFDAKVVGEKSASALDATNVKIVKPHQAAHLSRMARAGAIAGLLVNCGRMGDVRWLDGRHLIPPRRIGWDDPAWLILGPSVGLVPLRALVRAYLSPPAVARPG
jgi:hypothetical protein